VSTEQQTVLVVDDEPRFVRAHERWLQDDYEIRTATNGEQALEEIDSDVDVVLLDRKMPSMDGDEVVPEIRADDELADCVIIMISSVDPDFDIVELGFDDYLTKPATEESLKSTIQEGLEQRDSDEKCRELHALSTKRELLEERCSSAKLESDDRTVALDDRISTLREQIGSDCNA